MKRTLPGPALIALGATLIATAFGWLQPIDQRIQDLRASLLQQTVSSDLVIVEIDARSLRALDAWPWPRRHHAAILDRLQAAGVESIFYDVDFSSPSTPEDDRLLADALARLSSDGVMLPVFVQPGNQLATGELVVAQPLPQFREHSVPVAINLRPDHDGLVRRIAGSVRIADDHATLAGIRISGQFDQINRTIPIDYAIHPGSFERLSFTDVLNGQFDPELLRGRPVFVGATALELGDMIPVPIYQSLPGVVVQALAYQTLMQGGFRQAPAVMTLLSTLLLFALMRTVLRNTGWRGGLAFTAAASVLILSLAILVAHEWRILAAVAPMICLLTLGYGCSLIARLEQQHHRLRHQASHDALTGLGNRYYLADRLRTSLVDGDPNATRIALLMIDLDRFKEINDSLGHGTGDRLLKQVAERLTACLGDGASLARIGGDEFAIIVPDAADARHSQTVARQILTALRQPFPVDNIALEVDASIGIALYPEHAREAALLMQHADTAMYVAKESGAGISLYQPEFAHRNAIRLAISTGLRGAIASDQLRLYYQPKLGIDGGKPTGAEALLRWHHPELGDINPELIVDIAESAGLIWTLTEWTLLRALEDARRWHEAGHPLRVAVNLSARLLQDRELVEKITGCVTARGLDRRWLTLEITESALMADPDAALRNAAALKAAGIHLSIDDFGTGYSSLGYLKDLPADELKIDKSFVIDMLDAPRNAVIVKSTIELAHNLGLEVVAEGVESGAILGALAGLGCETAQGYFISRPLDAVAFGEWIDAQRRDVRMARPATADIRLLAGR